MPGTRLRSTRSFAAYVAQDRLGTSGEAAELARTRSRIGESVFVAEERRIQTREMTMSLGTILVILLILILIGALPTWPYSSGWGYYPSGGLGLVVIILLI